MGRSGSRAIVQVARPSAQSDRNRQVGECSAMTESPQRALNIRIVRACRHAGRRSRRGSESDTVRPGSCRRLRGVVTIAHTPGTVRARLLERHPMPGRYTLDDIVAAVNCEVTAVGWKVNAQRKSAGRPAPGRARSFSTAGAVVGPGVLMTADHRGGDVRESPTPGERRPRWHRVPSRASALSAVRALVSARFPEKRRQDSGLLAQKTFSSVGGDRRASSHEFTVRGGAFRVLCRTGLLPDQYATGRLLVQCAGPRLRRRPASPGPFLSAYRGGHRRSVASRRHRRIAVPARGRPAASSDTGTRSGHA